MILKMLYAFQKEKGRNMKHCCHGDGRLSVFDLTIMKFWSTGIPIDCSCSYLKQAWESNCSAKYVSRMPGVSQVVLRGANIRPLAIGVRGLLFTCACVLCGVNSLINGRNTSRAGSPMRSVPTPWCCRTQTTLCLGPLKQHTVQAPSRPWR